MKKIKLYIIQATEQICTSESSIHDVQSATDGRVGAARCLASQTYIYTYINIHIYVGSDEIIHNVCRNIDKSIDFITTSTPQTAHNRPPLHNTKQTSKR